MQQPVCVLTMFMWMFLILLFILYYHYLITGDLWNKRPVLEGHLLIIDINFVKDNLDGEKETAVTSK